jgi:hypothetical protein
MTAFSKFGAWVFGAAFLVAASQASALTLYPDYAGPGVTFTLMQEASSSGDPEPLFDAPTGVGDQLLFFPPAFTATAAGAGGFDHTGSQFQARVTSNNALSVITTVNITEFGDAQIFGAGGTAATGTFAALAGFITVLEDINGPIAPVVIPFTGTFAPGSNLDFVNDFGVTIWSGTASVNVAAYVANATVVQISLDNDLYAFSEAGTSAKLQKKVVNGPAVIIDVIPEPGTALLIGSGLLIMGFRGRRSRVA